jgi:hypothetical protein
MLQGFVYYRSYTGTYVAGCVGLHTLHGGLSLRHNFSCRGENKSIKNNYLSYFYHFHVRRNGLICNTYGNTLATWDSGHDH